MSYSPEQIAEATVVLDNLALWTQAEMLRSYAATLRQQAARVDVTHDNSASVAAIQFALHGEDGMAFLRCWNEGNFDACREEWPEAPAECYIGADPLEAALSAQPAERQGEVLIEAVGRVERDMTGELGINWLVEGGIAALVEGSVLLCSEHDYLTDGDGSATLYTHPAAPVGVPDGLLRKALTIAANMRTADWLDAGGELSEQDALADYLAAALSAQPAERQGDALKSIEARLRLAIEHGNTHGWETARNEIEGILGSYYFTHPAAPVGVPDGWVLVPINPTPFMVAEGEWARRQVDGTLADAWKAMIQSIPVAPSAPQGVER